MQKNQIWKLFFCHIFLSRCRKRWKVIWIVLKKYLVSLMYYTEKHEYVLFRFQPTVWICIETWQTDEQLHSHSVCTSRTPHQDSGYECGCCLCHLQWFYSLSRTLHQMVWNVSCGSVHGRPTSDILRKKGLLVHWYHHLSSSPHIYQCYRSVWLSMVK